MSAPHTSSEKSSSLWSILNMVIGFALGGMVLLWVLAFIAKGFSSLAPEPKKDPQVAAATAAAPAPAAAAPATAAPAAPASAEPAAGLPVLEVTIKPDPAMGMAFDLKTISAKAGQKVKLTFNNTHATMPLPHNFVLGKLGVDKNKMLSLAMASMTLVDKGFVPESPDILTHTKLIQPGQTETIEFVVPAAGEYYYICTYPGHGTIMNGVLTAQ